MLLTVLVRCRLQSLRRSASPRRAPRPSQRQRHPSTAAARVEVCPPALLRLVSAATPGWRAWLLASIDVLWPDAPRRDTERRAVRLMAGAAPFRVVRLEFCECLADIIGAPADAVLARIRLARSMRDLWHLRADIFNLVASERDQAEADRRLARLNRHFPIRAARSGFELRGPAADRPPQVSR